MSTTRRSALPGCACHAEYLEETRPERALLPTTPGDRALARAIAADIGADIQPVQNLRVLLYVMGFFDDKAEKTKHKIAWGHDWIERGFKGVEAKLAKSAGKYCVGDSITIADCFLVPQVYNARRFNVRTGLRHACPGIAGMGAVAVVPNGATAVIHDCAAQVDMAQFPTISRVTDALEALPEFKAAHPDAMPDANT